MEGINTQHKEKHLSQIPALAQLINLGFGYLSPEQCREERGNTSNLLLENILKRQLSEINAIRYRGKQYSFSEENISTAVRQLRDIRFDGLQKTNEKVYEQLTLGATLEQVINDDRRSFPFRYIDWENWENNVFHVTAEFTAQRPRSSGTVRMDIVLFVNGIPLAVIECKPPSVEVDEGVSQLIDYQRDNGAPRLFTSMQLVVATNKNAVKYATAGTPAKFWGVWKEKEDKASAVANSVNQPLTEAQKDNLFSGHFKEPELKQWFEELSSQPREVTEQDRNIHSLCRPERLLELAWRFTVFDAGIKKIARHQQYFVIKASLRRITHRAKEGHRPSGVIWHTQGSGKSLTMVMLTRNLLLDSHHRKGIKNPRVVLVTDRTDLDRQLGNTFRACQLNARRAKSGRHLLQLASEEKAELVTTLINKFDKALNARKFRDLSSDIIVLVDESHRSQYKNFAARMRQMLPKACYLGFTGTPLTKKEKNTFARFGDLIRPAYTMHEAVEDGAVVPLLYEGRHVEMEQNKKAMDSWFDRHTNGLSKEQKADLKRKYARAEMLNRAEQVVYMRAFDISEHFREHWQGTGFKAQLVAPRKEVALLYKQFFDEIGYVSSEVVISAPENHEGADNPEDEPDEAIVKFWKRMMKRFGSEEEYVEGIVNQFKHTDHPEILIVVSKLLTGFDASRNTVLYLCSSLKEHTLLQAIARVNRLHSFDLPAEDPDSDEEKVVTVDKEFGYIVDYVSVLGELDKALNQYKAFENYDEQDLAGVLTRLQDVVNQLPQHHSDLWELFAPVRNRQDEEAFELLLGDREIREEFYERLSQFARTLSMALSCEKFIANTSEEKIRQYKADMRRFSDLRQSVKIRYCDAVNYRDYEPKIKKLLDTHIQANEVTQLNEAVNIFDHKAFGEVKEQQGVYEVRSDQRTPAAIADAIAHRTAKRISERMDDDPAFYEKFSKLIQQAIDDFRNQRISEQEYLNQARELADKVENRVNDELPESLTNHEHAQAYFGAIKSFFKDLSKERQTTLSADTALAIDAIFMVHWKVGFWDDEDAIKRVKNDIDDYLYDEVNAQEGVNLPLEQMDAIIEAVVKLAKRRMTG